MILYIFGSSSGSNMLTCPIPENSKATHLNKIIETFFQLAGFLLKLNPSDSTLKDQSVHEAQTTLTHLLTHHHYHQHHLVANTSPIAPQGERLRARLIYGLNYSTGLVKCVSWNWAAFCMAITWEPNLAFQLQRGHIAVRGVSDDCSSDAPSAVINSFWSSHFEEAPLCHPSSGHCERSRFTLS